MQTITALKQQRRNKQRTSIFLDDEFAFGVPTVVAEALHVGLVVSAEKIAELQDQSTIEAAKQSAMLYLSFRPRSSAEIRRNLSGKTYEDEVIEQTLVWLEENQLHDDLQFAQYWIEQRETFKPRSHMALRQELRQKGIDTHIIADVLSDIDELASARRAAEMRAERWIQLPEDEFRLKLGRHLHNRGFYYGIIREVTDELWDFYKSGDEPPH